MTVEDQLIYLVNYLEQLNRITDFDVKLEKKNVIRKINKLLGV